MIDRKIKKQVLKLAKSYPVVAITGPRQSGKTTLVKEIFKGYHYVNLEDVDMRQFAINDPRGFLQQFSEKVIIDEAQNAPDLFSYILGVVDECDVAGQYILTGSQNFLLHDKISQSLAGRAAIFYLLPLSIAELKSADGLSDNLENLLYKGQYPRIYAKNLDPSQWYKNYLKTYIERDIRLMKNVHDLGTFQTFLKMCATRCGQLLDLTSLGNDCGINYKTAKAWINLLEASFIVFQLRPHFNNLGKRLVKSPKLYFYDTGLLCALLSIENKEQIQTHYMRGGVFESFVLSNLMKNQLNNNKDPSLYFWRDQQGHEVDCILEQGSDLLPIEIKSGKTVSPDYFKGLNYWNKLSEASPDKSFLIYGGNSNQKRSNAQVLSWKDLDKIF